MAKEKGKTILVPVQFTTQPELIDQALLIASVINAEVMLLHVVESDSLYELHADSKKPKEQRKKAIDEVVNEQLDKMMLKVKSDWKKMEVTIVRKTTFGKVYKEIVRVADETNARLIVMGANSEESRLEHIIGNNASRVIRTAKCPVITIRDKSRIYQYKNILLPLDLSKETRDKVRIALETALQFKSTIHVVSIGTSADEFNVNKLNRQLSVVKEQLKQAGVPCTTKLIQGKKIAEDILEYGSQVKADSVFIMTQQEVGFVEMLIGTSAQQVINNADIPVISIRPMERSGSYSNVFGV